METTAEEEAERTNGLMPGALRCSEAVRYPYILTTGPGQGILVLK
jgi:hypothetical protein